MVFARNFIQPAEINHSIHMKIITSAYIGRWLILKESIEPLGMLFQRILDEIKMLVYVRPKLKALDVLCCSALKTERSLGQKY